MIEDYLRRNPPSHQDWATDWNATIISKGKLFADNKLGRVLEAPSSTSSTPRNTNPIRPPRLPLRTSVWLVGRVDIAGLKNHVGGKGQKRMENPGEVLNALNIISWKEITKTGSEIRSWQQVLSQKSMEEGARNREIKEGRAMEDRKLTFSGMASSPRCVRDKLPFLSTSTLSPRHSCRLSTCKHGLSWLLTSAGTLVRTNYPIHHRHVRSSLSNNKLTAQPPLLKP